MSRLTERYLPLAILHPHSSSGTHSMPFNRVPSGQKHISNVGRLQDAEEPSGSAQLGGQGGPRGSKVMLPLQGGSVYKGK